MRCRRLVYGCLILFWLLLARPPAVQAELLQEASSEEPVAAGVVFRQITRETGAGPQRIYLLTVDLRNPYVRLGLLFGEDNQSYAGTRTVQEMAERAGAVAALNGDYFHLKEGKHPLGLSVSEGTLLTSPMRRNDYYAFALTKDGRPLIDIFPFSGEVIAPNGLSFYPLAGINKPSYQALVNGQPVNSDADALHLYTPAWGKVSRGTEGSSCAAELVVVGGRVQEIRQGRPGAPIPPDGYVLRGEGLAAAFLLDNFRVGDPVTIYYRLEPPHTEMQLAVGGYALLVADGKPVKRLTQSSGGRAARSAVAFSRDGRLLYLVAVEQSPASVGMTLEELASFLAERLGAWRALNLDGGGSTSLVARPLGEDKPVLVNTPAKGAVRKVPNAIGVFSTAPRGELAGLVIRGPQEIIAGLPYRYRVTGYDTYYNPYPVDPETVTWKVSGGAGIFTGQELTVFSSGSLVLTAQVGNVTGSIRVKALGTEALARLEVTPARIRLAPGEQVKLSVQLYGKDGRTWILPPQSVHWEVSGGTGSVVDDTFCAGKEVAAGWLIGRFASLEARVPVEIAPPGKEFYWVEPDGEVELGEFTLKFPRGSISQPVALQATPLSQASEVPSGYRFCAGLRFLLFGELSPGATYLVRWHPQGQNLSPENARFFVRCQDGSWQALPSLSTGGTLVGRSDTIGELIVAYREGEVYVPADLATHWACPTVAQLVYRGVITGFPDGTFRPDAPLTRAQFVALLAKAFGWPEPTEAALPFRDAIPTWALPGISAAVARGIVSGYPDGRFLPDKPVTRTELALIIERVLQLPPGSVPIFRDAALIPPWAAPAVGRAAAAGLITGTGGFFRPLATATRAEAAVVVMRALSYYLR